MQQERHKNSFFEEMQRPWQTMYLNWATELHYEGNTNKECKNGQSAKSTKSQLPQATSKPYSCALWVFKTIFFFPFLLSLLRISAVFGKTNYLLPQSLLKRGEKNNPKQKTPTQNTHKYIPIKQRIKTNTMACSIGLISTDCIPSQNSNTTDSSYLTI